MRYNWEGVGKGKMQEGGAMTMRASKEAKASNELRGEEEWKLLTLTLKERCCDVKRYMH